MFPLALKCVLFCCMKLVVLGHDQHPEINKQHFQGYIKLLIIEKERGFIQIVLKHASAQNTQKDEKLSFLPNVPLGVCLAHATHRLIWMYDQCIRFDNTNEKTIYNRRNQLMEKHGDDFFFKIMEKPSSTHLTVLNANNNSVLQSVPLSSLVPLSDEDRLIQFNSNKGNPGLFEFNVNVFLICPPGKYGPLCSVSCTPPTKRHRCDPKTGKAKCQGKWSGPDCNKNVFINRVEASQFIQQRNKRASNVGGFEEFRQGNIERECNEESCNREEAREAFENNQLTEDFWQAYTDTDQCNPSPCVASNTVNCQDLIRNYTCNCKPGYRGKNCQIEIDSCRSHPCQNGAVCQRHSVTSFACLCQTGFRGLNCEENIDDCVESNCSPQGTCVDGINSFTCNCSSGFTGSTCSKEIDECLSDPCVNGGTCTDGINYYSCACPHDYYGKNCENRRSPCESEPCLHNGECILNDDYTYNCSCRPGFVGDYCQHSNESACFSSPCANGGVCYLSNNNTFNDSASQAFECDCPDIFRGARCEKRIPTCELFDNPCPYNSTCVSLTDDYICVCPEGYVGNHCQYRGEDEEALLELLCKNSSCLNGARCLVLGNDTVCVCRTGYNGTKCENEVDFCSSSPCNNNGQCIPVPTGYHCVCSEGYEGKNCESDINECDVENHPCNTGTCNNTLGSFHCMCDAFHTGRFCEATFDPCSSAPCQSGGTCQLNEIGYICDCLHGHGGRNCEEIVDPCTNFTNPCQNNANCTEDPRDPSIAVCLCSRDFYGRKCEKARDNCAVETNETALVNGEEIPILKEREDCGINGICRSTRIGFVCVCRKGFVGRRCDTEYTTPVVNCSSESCKCSQKIVEETHYHLGKDSVVPCRYVRGNDGVCAPVTCLTESCVQSESKLECKWKSQCLAQYNKNDDKNSEESFFCPVLEVGVDRRNLSEALTVEDFCQEMRELPSYNRHSNDTLLHCMLLDTNNSISTVAVAVDNSFSEQVAVLLASDIFQFLELLLPSKSKQETTSDLSPVFQRIVAVKYSSYIGHPPQESKAVAHVNYIPYIIVAIVIVVVIFIFIIFIVFRRRKASKGLEVTYIVNPNVIEKDNSNGNSGFLNNSNVEKSANEDFVNPVFVENRPICHALTSNPIVRENTYIAAPEKSNVDAVKSSNSSETSDLKESDKRKRDFSGYEVMNPLTLPYDLRFPPKDVNPYDFAEDGRFNSPKFERKEFRNQKSSGKEISSGSKRTMSKDSYEVTDSVSDKTQSMDKRSSSSSADKDYDFTSNTPDELRSGDSSESLSNPFNESESNDKKTSSSSKDKDATYQSPSSLFPEHDDLFFPEKKSDPIYSVPRKAKPDICT